LFIDETDSFLGTCIANARAAVLENRSAGYGSNQSCYAVLSMHARPAHQSAADRGRTMKKWTRRTFIATASVLGGGLAVGLGAITFAPNRMGLIPSGASAGRYLTTWIKIASDNTITAIIPHCEMGQGVHTALAMMLAEELEADWSLVRVQEAPAESAFANGYVAPVFVPAFASAPSFMARSVDYLGFKLMQMMQLQVTGGSSAVRGTGRLGMRVAGAAAKTMLIKAGAQRWNVPSAECVARLSSVMHGPSGRSHTFGELAADAAMLEPPVDPVLKSRSAYSIVGRSIPRFDTPAKVDGSAKYGIDVTLPGMLHASVMASPVFGAKLASVDSTAIESMPGVRKIVRLDDAVAVVAESYWHALKALRAARPTFTQTGRESASSDSIFAALSASLDDDQAQEVFALGDARKAFEGSSAIIQSEYRVPFLAHAAMEPVNATARIADGRCEVWTGVQDPLYARKVAARAAGYELDQVSVHNHWLGGSFGRRLPGAHDFVDQAVRIAKELAPTPVKLIWSREEDMRRDYYRPAVAGRYRGALNADGSPHAWSAVFNSLDEDGQPAVVLPYAIEHQRMQAVPDDHHIRKGSWRSVAHSEHGFFTESFIDELAHAAGQDPLEYRRKLLAHKPRHRAVVERVAALAGWGQPLPAGRGRGIALVESYGSIVAEVAEVEILDRRITVPRVWAVVDCGEVIHPSTAAAQIEGGVMFGLAAALFNEITIRDGRVVQSNFSDYPMPRISDAPRMVIEFIESGAPLGGLGEPGVPPIAPAIANAVFAATGQRLRSLPLRLEPHGAK
jgi:isoquinoline 1-oxidoreductase subunit beta